MKTSRVDNVSLTPENMVVTNIDDNVSATHTFDPLMLASIETTPPTTTTSSDVFLIPPPRNAISKLCHNQSSRYAQKSYWRPSAQTHYIINPPAQPQPTTPPVRQEQTSSNDNSLLRALIQRPALKLPTTSVMRSIHIPIMSTTSVSGAVIRPTTANAGTKRTGSTKTPRRNVTSTVTSAQMGRQSRVSRTPVTATVTSFAVTTAATLTYGTTSTLTIGSDSTISYTSATPYGYHATEKRARLSTPVILPFTHTTTSTSTVTPRTSVRADNHTPNARPRPFTTSTVTSYTLTNLNTPIRILTSESVATTTPATRVRTNVTSTVTQMSQVMTPVVTPVVTQVVSQVVTQVVTQVKTQVATPVVTTHTATSATQPTFKIPQSTVQNVKKEFVEPLPVSELRVIPAARTFSGPRKPVVTRHIIPGGTQRVLIRHAGPTAIIKSSNSAAKTSDTIVTLLRTGNTKTVTTTSAISHNVLPHTVLAHSTLSHTLAHSALPHSTLTHTTLSHSALSQMLAQSIPSSISFATTSDGMTHTLIVPHYKNTVFKNLSCITQGENDEENEGMEEPAQISPTEHILIRRPVAIWTPCTTLTCVTSTQSTSTTTTPKSKPKTTSTTTRSPRTRTITITTPSPQSLPAVTSSSTTTTTHCTIIRTLPMSMADSRLIFARFDAARAARTAALATVQQPEATVTQPLLTITQPSSTVTQPSPTVTQPSPTVAQPTVKTPKKPDPKVPTTK